MLMSRPQAKMDGLLETEWQAHWSKKDGSQKASKTVFEQGPDVEGFRGINVQSHEESLTEYLDSEVSC